VAQLLTGNLQLDTIPDHSTVSDLMGNHLPEGHAIARIDPNKGLVPLGPNDRIQPGATHVPYPGFRRGNISS